MRFFAAVNLKIMVFFTAVCLLAVPAHALSKRDENLIYNANFGTATKVAELLRSGANPNAVGADKWPAVSLATMRGDVEGLKIVQLLVEAGADLNVRDANGETPLMNAIAINNASLVRYMIEHGADYHARTTAGNSVLTYAEHYGNEQVAFLISEAIRLEKERFVDGQSSEYMHQMLDDYIYYNCTMQYIAFNQATRLYRGKQKAEAEELMQEAEMKAAVARTELEHRFLMRPSHLNSVRRETQGIMMHELEAMISERNRLRQGVGKKEDMEKRCNVILKGWQSSYKDYETGEQTQ